MPLRRLKLATVGIVAAALIGAAPAAGATNLTYQTIPGFGSVIQVFGETDSDQITVSLSGNTITITDLGPGGITTASVPTCTPVNPTTVTCPLDAGAGPIREFDAFLNAGDDSFVNQNLAVINQITPDDGADSVQTGTASDFVDDSVGPDTVNGGAGADFLDGTSGNTDTGPDVLDGGPGDDLVDYGGLPVGVTVTLGDQLANDGLLTGEGDNLLRIERVEGTDFADSLRGSAASNGLFGETGDDLLAGLAGNDDLSGGAGDDSLNGGASRDGSPDRLDCGIGTDLALAQPEDRVLVNCERGGAVVVGDNAPVSRRHARVKVKCPALEVSPCFARLRLLLNGHNISKGRKLKIRPGKTTTTELKLTRPGKRSLRRNNGKLLVSALVDTREPGGFATTRAQILLFR